MKSRFATRPASSPRLRAGEAKVLLPAAPAPRNPVALALAARGASGASGRHLRSGGAQRRAERVALQKALVQGSKD